MEPPGAPGVRPTRSTTSHRSARARRPLGRQPSTRQVSPFLISGSSPLRSPGLGASNRKSSRRKIRRSARCAGACRGLARQPCSAAGQASASPASSSVASVLVLVHRGRAIGRAAGPLQPAAGCAEHTTRGSRAAATAQPTRLLQPWQRHSEARTAARAEAVVARPGRARLDASDHDRAPSLLDRRSRSSTVTSVRRHGPYRRSPRSRSRGLSLRQAERSSHRSRDNRCSVSSLCLADFRCQ